MRAELTCDDVRPQLSARLDGELDRDTTAALDQHLKRCAGCAGFETRLRAVRRAVRVSPAEEVPDLTSPIMDRVAVERPRSVRWPHVRTGLVAAATAALLFVGVTTQLNDRPADIAHAGEIVRRVTAAARALEAYHATFSITEHGWHNAVPVRRFSAELWFEAPERFRLQLRDLTTYPDPRQWPANDVDVIASENRYWIEEPFTCPVQALPACAPPSATASRSVVGRQPFDGTTVLPTDVIVPLQTIAGAGGFDRIGEGRMDGREVYRIALSYYQAVPLIDAFTGGGSWRPYHPLDEVELWLDKETWFPLRYTVRAGRAPEREEWERSNFVSDKVGELLLRVDVRSFDEPDDIPNDRFAAPTSSSSVKGGFSSGRFSVLARAAAPSHLAGLEPYRAGRVRRSIVLSYADGMTWMKVTSTRTNGRAARRAAADPAAAEEIRLSSGSIAYYRPADDALRRELDVYGPERYVHIATNLARNELLEVAASLDVRGRRIRPQSDGRGLLVRRIDKTDDLTAFPFAKFPTRLPPGYSTRPTIALLYRSHGTHRTLVVYYRRSEAEYEGTGIKLTQSPGQKLPPSAERFVGGVDLGEKGRWSAERSELEWIDGNVYRAVRVPAFDLATALEIARGLD
jgi:outer membrane lipoprotein-sorting protein